MKSGSKRQSLWILSTEKSCNVKASNFCSLTNILPKAPCRQKLKEPLLILTNMFSELPLSARPNNSIKYQLKRGTKINSEAEKQLAPARLSHKTQKTLSCGMQTPPICPSNYLSSQSASCASFYTDAPRCWGRRPWSKSPSPAMPYGLMSGCQPLLVPSSFCVPRSLSNNTESRFSVQSWDGGDSHPCRQDTSDWLLLCLRLIH